MVDKHKGLFFKGVVIDKLSNTLIHKAEASSLEDFEEFFTKPVRRKLA